jgi:hypothetical protein
MVVRRTFGPERDVVIGGWTELYGHELNNLYSSPNFIRIIKSRRLRCGSLCSTDGIDEKFIHNFGWKA